MINCPECDHAISSKAQSCVNCGYPISQSDEHKDEVKGVWSAAVKSKTPINIFSLAMMGCSSVLGVSAGNIDNEYDLLAFKYKLHMFLATIGMFFVTLLFCRNGIYHPEDMAKAKEPMNKSQLRSASPEACRC